MRLIRGLIIYKNFGRIILKDSVHTFFRRNSKTTRMGYVELEKPQSIELLNSTCLTMIFFLRERIFNLK